ncbi:MAG TPA: hypothetical protein VKT27_13620 [Candidatus Binataceae bacterium]|nr:hypothetical protein [Candidatus Binataceae bacterium]
MPETKWATHDFAVKMLDWSAARGSRLAYSCRRCGRMFCLFSLVSRDAWAIDGKGRPLDSLISNRWLAEACPRSFSANDDEDRKRLSASGPRS